MSDYKKTVGIEVHCELKTNTKMFSSAANAYGDEAILILRYLIWLILELFLLSIMVRLC